MPKHQLNDRRSQRKNGGRIRQKSFDSGGPHENPVWHRGAFMKQGTKNLILSTFCALAVLLLPMVYAQQRGAPATTTAGARGAAPSQTPAQAPAAPYRAPR